MLIFIAAWLNGFCIVTNRLLKGIDIFTVMFLHGLVGILFGIGYVIEDGLANGDMFSLFKYTPLQYFLMTISCLLDVTCMYTLFVAAQSGTQSFIGLILYTSIIYAFLADLFYFNE